MTAQKRCSDRAGRGILRSPGRPGAARREDRRQFWALIAAGVASDDAAVGTRIAVAVEAGRDGFRLARWLTGHGIEAHVIHSSSVAVSREYKRAKTDRLDTAMLMRVFLGWLRGKRGHCGMVAIPTIEEEDASGRAVNGRTWSANVHASSIA